MLNSGIDSTAHTQTDTAAAAAPLPRVCVQYHSLYAFFSRDNVALPGIAAFFKKESEEERGHAELLMDYQVRAPWEGCCGDRAFRAAGASGWLMPCRHG